MTSAWAYCVRVRDQMLGLARPGSPRAAAPPSGCSARDALSWHHQDCSSPGGRGSRSRPARPRSRRRTAGRTDRWRGVRALVAAWRPRPVPSPRTGRGAEPGRHPPPVARRSHQVTVPVVEPGPGASAVISWVPPPVSAIRSGSGPRGGAGRDGPAASRSRTSDRRDGAWSDRRRGAGTARAAPYGAYRPRGQGIGGQRERQPRQPVDAGGDVVLLLEVLAQRGVVLAREALGVQRRGPRRTSCRAPRIRRCRGSSSAWTTMMARSPCGVGSMAGKWRAAPSQRGSSRKTGSPAAVHPHDVRRPLEGAPHQGDAAVLAEVGDGLGVAAGEVEVGDGPLVDDARSRRPLGERLTARRRGGGR